MTNKEDDADHTSDPRMAALLATHLVGQVLDEAYIIANAAIETGQPWRQMSIFKNFKSSRLNDTDEQDGCSVNSKCDIDVVNENKMEHVANIVATSTPQKVAGESKNTRPNSAYIGQGDEDLEMQQNGLIKSTSMFLNHLFDMSDVETVVLCDDNDLVQNNTEPSNLLTQAMSKIMESYINTALYIALNQNIELDDAEVPNNTPSPEYSDYSFLEDAFAFDVSKDTSFYTHNDESDSNDLKSPNVIESTEITEINDIYPEAPVEKNEVARYEHAYLTMNRDFDQYYEDDGDPVLQDLKGMTMQEVELLTANSSNIDIAEQRKCNAKYLTATSAVSASASGSKKSTLVRRCRVQGSRLMACFRGWWRCKTPSKRREARVTGSFREMCHLSPDAKRRAASLLDQRLLRAAPPSRPVLCKFNTVNEALVNSSRWKDYTFDVKLDESGD